MTCGSPSCDASGANDRKIDISLRDHVEQVGEDVLGGNSEDLHDLAIAEAGIADRLDVSLGDVSTLAHDPGCETHCGIRLRVTGRTLAIESDLLGAGLGEVQAQIAVRREACLCTASRVGLEASGTSPSRSIGAAFAGATSLPSSSSYPRSDLRLSASWAASAWVNSRASSNNSAS